MRVSSLWFMFTYGIKGKVFTDHFEFEGKCRAPGNPEWNKKYYGAIHLGRGIIDNPSGEQMNIWVDDDAFDVLIERAILNFLLDLQKDNII